MCWRSHSKHVCIVHVLYTCTVSAVVALISFALCYVLCLLHCFPFPGKALCNLHCTCTCMCTCMYIHTCWNRLYLHFHVHLVVYMYICHMSLGGNTCRHYKYALGIYVHMRMCSEMDACAVNAWYVHLAVHFPEIRTSFSSDTSPLSHPAMQTSC